MGESRLNSLTLANTFKEREIDVDRVVNVFSHKKWPLKIESVAADHKQTTQLNIFMFCTLFDIFKIYCIKIKWFTECNI